MGIFAFHVEIRSVTRDGEKVKKEPEEKVPEEAEAAERRMARSLFSFA